METGNGPKLFRYDIGKKVTAFSTQRQGGVSEGTYASFNANAFCGDNPAHVSHNRRLLCDALSLQPENLIIPHQTHHDKVYKIDKDFLKKPENQRLEILEGIDAVMTDLPNVCVCVSTADCIPILLYDACHHAVAAAHAGWRGTVLSITERTIEAMNDSYDTNPAELRAVIGPGISIDAFEVGDEVYETFCAARFPMDEIAKPYPTGNGDEYKWHIDLWKANFKTLENTGIPAANIQVAGICTYNNNDRFFSARRSGIHSGRILNGIMMTE